MTNSEIKKWAKEKIKGNLWTILPALIVAGIITNLTIGNTSVDSEGVKGTSISLGWVFYFVEVGFTYFMIKFITDKKPEFNDIFSYSKDFTRDLVVGLVQRIFVALWCLLLIVPGIIKAIAYSMVPYLLGDKKYNDLKTMEILKKSEEIMNGHKADYFMLQLSFIGWHLLAILTLGLLEIWIAPYQTTATTKFLYELKLAYEKANGTSDSKEETTNFCPKCGAKVGKGIEFCPECGEKL